MTVKYKPYIGSGHPLTKANIKKSKIMKEINDPAFIKKAYEWAEKNKAEDKITKWDLKNAERMGLLTGKQKWRNIGEITSKAGGGEIVIGKNVDKDLL